jgi:hypothetical protein
VVRKRTTPALTEDDVRQAILRFLYDKWKNPSGMRSAKPKIKEIRKALKEEGIDHRQVIRNLQYMVDTGWVKEIVTTSTFRTKKGNLVNSPSTSFMIGSQGIEYFEGRSRFEKKEGAAGIRIGNVSGVVVIGDNNIIRQEFERLFKSLDELDGKIRMTDQLSDGQKLEYSSEVKTIQSQLSKSNPDKGILSRAWNKIKEIAPIASLANVIERIGSEIGQSLGNLPPPS